MNVTRFKRLWSLKAPRIPQENRKTFSDDVLNIEICGSEQDHLGAIDVPGIFTRTEGLTMKKGHWYGQRNGHDMYEKNPRSATPAVISANIEYRNPRNTGDGPSNVIRKVKRAFGC